MGMSSSYSPSISAPSKRIRVLVADRSPMNSQLLAESLGRNSGFEITGTAVAKEVLSLVSLYKTDVAVISVELDGATQKGLQIARSLHARYPDVRIVVLLDVGSRESVLASFR